VYAGLGLLCSGWVSFAGVLGSSYVGIFSFSLLVVLVYTPCVRRDALRFFII
jgi:hypothetical protein